MSVTESEYAWETKPMYRDETDVRVATMFHFEDEPLAFYYDAAGEEADMVVIEYEDDYVMTRLGHDVAKAFAEDADEYIPRAAAVTPEATSEEMQAIHADLHPELVE